MPFNWLKKKTTEAIVRPRLPIMVAQIAPIIKPSSLNGSKAVNHNHQPERLRTLGDPIDCDHDIVESHPQGRCGFTTGVHDKTLKSTIDMSEKQPEKLPKDDLFRDRVMAAESLEECLKIIEAEAANLVPEESRKVPEKVGTHNSIPVFENSGKKLNQCPEEHGTDSSDDFSLWGNRINK